MREAPAWCRGLVAINGKGIGKGKEREMGVREWGSWLWEREWEGMGSGKVVGKWGKGVVGLLTLDERAFVVSRDHALALFSSSRSRDSCRSPW
jgi:hypothetical protein